MCECMLEALFAPVLDGHAKHASASQKTRQMLILKVALIIIAVVTAVMVRIAMTSAPMLMPALMTANVSMGMWRAVSPGRLRFVVASVFIIVDSESTAVDVEPMPMAMLSPILY